MKIMLVAGARPNFMKIASIVDAIREHNRHASQPMVPFVVHTGQHYDHQMSHVFFSDLDLPEPDVNLGVGSSSHGQQTAEIMVGFEPVLLRERPDVLVVVGDVNSSVACSLVATKIRYPEPSLSHQRLRPLLAHVEAGLRSFDRSMPEEVNRVLTDAVADLLFTTEESAEVNLLREGIPKERIKFVGNTMVDTLLKHRGKAGESRILERLRLSARLPPADGGTSESDGYAVLTLHRPSNVDDAGTLRGIVSAIVAISEQIPVLFPVHPRTMKRITEFGLDRQFTFLNDHDQLDRETTRVRCLEALGYLDFVCLLSHARLVLTDSGGIQEETTVLGVPCVTLRENTERPVTITSGTNVLAGTLQDDIIRHATDQLRRPVRSHSPPLWDGNAGGRIVDELSRYLGAPTALYSDRADSTGGG